MASDRRETQQRRFQLGCSCEVDSTGRELHPDQRAPLHFCNDPWQSGPDGRFRCFFNPKNSNGENAPRSAWHRKLSGFTAAKDFDWKEFDKPPEERKIIKLDHLREVFGDGKKRLELKEAAHDLATLVEVTESAAYNALKEDGKFSANISRSNRMLTFHSTKIPRKSR